MKNKDELINSEVKKTAISKFYKHKKRCIDLGKTPPKKEDFIKILELCYYNGFRCFYCGNKLELHTSYPFKNAPSFDHYIPLTMGGESTKDNLVVSCHACNILKGTLLGDAYQDLLIKIGVNSDLHKRIVEESFNGKLVNKIERLESEAKAAEKTQTKLTLITGGF